MRFYLQVIKSNVRLVWTLNLFNASWLTDVRKRVSLAEGLHFLKMS